MLCFHFHLFQDIFLISLLISSLTFWFFMSVLISFHIFVNCLVFFLWLIYGFIQLWSEKIFAVSLIFLNKLRLVWPVCPGECSVCTEKNVHSSALGWNVL